MRESRANHSMHSTTTKTVKRKSTKGTTFGVYSFKQRIGFSSGEEESINDRKVE